MRIQKYLSEQKILSRREAEDYIRKGLITLNGKVVREMGVQIDPKKDKIAILGRGLKESAGKMTVAVNKPRGVVCSKIESEGVTIFQIFPKFKNLNVVGRLDKDSEGLLLLSNDGVITAAITGKDHLIEKEYEVSVREEINNSKAKRMEQGIKLEDGMTLPARVKILSPHKFLIVLKEGRKHQIRRMCAAVFLTVTGLKRLRIGNIYLGDLKSGSGRILEKGEVDKLKSLAKKLKNS
ncbi:rRNA pseudouridine synthase [Candidatus Wolfebacteria bacterium]|nr:rRNA pseudouridine synthase [Candidatus Wolfebacteria bacterium]